MWTLSGMDASGDTKVCAQCKPILNIQDPLHFIQFPCSVFISICEWKAVLRQGEGSSVKLISLI